MPETTPPSFPPGKRETQAGTSHPAPGNSLLFLREDELRTAQDMVFFALRDLNGPPDAILASMDFGRAHHRCLHWIGRKPGLKVGELLSILGITKQSLTRVLGPLIRDGYVDQVPGPKDRRQRLLSLTEKGAALERKLFESQRERLLSAYREAGGPAVEGFKRVMRGLINEQGRAHLDALEAPRPAKAPRSP
ncbi:MarR family winged helix-turn-helix transcriptional regulator [Acidocella facilis]|uniref:MarR family winged helix-turn-helix transcriptional regulator n=1 Tax=Acidocella facilis TaxID=525 RepID=UPI001F46888F|nr:MarR family transcriptional regulator [Acidocella facilis]